MWTQKALVEALGKPGYEDYRENDADPGRRLLILNWQCNDGGTVKAVSNADNLFTLEVTCGDERHEALGRMNEARITNARVVDSATGDERSSVPPGLEGASFEFDLDSPVTVYVGAEAWLDPSTRYRVVEEFPAGLYGPGSHHIRVPLRIDPTGPGKHDGPARAEVELHVSILDPGTAARDRGTDGITLFRGRFPVAE